MTESNAPVGRLKAALDLAGLGFRVFPLKPGTKTPAVTDWQGKATGDPELIRKVWSRGDYNIGVKTGDGLVVIDVDVKNGKQGAESWAALGLSDEDRDTFTVQTASGGWHAYFRTDQPFGNSSGSLPPDIDVRGLGGYVVGPGSVLVDGAGAYTIQNDAPVAPLPFEFARRLSERRERAQDPHTPLVELDKPDALARAVDYLSTAPLALQGAGGDDLTYRVAARVKDFGVSAVQALMLMDEHWNERCSPPWDLEKLQEKVENAYAYGQSQPGNAHPAAAFAGIQLLPAEGEGIEGTRLRYLGDDGPIRQPEWLIKHWLPKVGVALLSGQSRVGKTFLAIALAGAAATGGSFFGRPVKQPTGVLIIAGEGAGTMELRLEALRLETLGAVDARHLPITWAAVNSAAEIPGCIDEARSMLQTKYGVSLGLVIIDTIAAVYNVADENEAHQATSAMLSLQRLARDGQCLVVGVNHFGKNAGAGVRGSSAWTASADVVLAATASINELTGIVSDRRLALIKSRFSETGPIGAYELSRVHLGVDSDLEPITSAVVRPTAPKPKGKRAPRYLSQFMECLNQAITENPTDVNGAAMAARVDVRRRFNQRVQIKDGGNRSREFTATLAAADVTIETMGGEEFMAPKAAVCAVAS